MGLVRGRLSEAVRLVRRWARMSAPVAGGGLLVLGAASIGGAQTIGYTASAVVARDTSETAKVASLYLFNGVDVSAGAIRVSASVPFIRQRTTFAAPLIDSTTSSASQRSVGFGDPLIRVDVRVLDDREHGLQVAVAGSVKQALVAANGLGTGVADYATGASALKVIGRTVVLADAMFWKVQAIPKGSIQELRGLQPRCRADAGRGTVVRHRLVCGFLLGWRCRPAIGTHDRRDDAGRAWPEPGRHGGVWADRQRQ